MRGTSPTSSSYCVHLSIGQHLKSLRSGQGALLVPAGNAGAVRQTQSLLEDFPSCCQHKADKKDEFQHGAGCGPECRESAEEEGNADGKSGGYQAGVGDRVWKGPDVLDILIRNLSKV